MSIAQDRLQRMQEEHRQLRQELESNRRFVFERPLVIAGAGFAAYVSLSTKLDLRLIPVPVLAVLLFNLWFTYNRLRSNARIISYIQVVHDPEASRGWVGWESALRRYRIWFASHSDPWRRIKGRPVPQHDSMGFYAPIFWFHFVLGVTVCGLVVLQPGALPWVLSSQGTIIDRVAVGVDLVPLVVFLGAALLVPAARLRMSIEGSRYVWEQVLPAEPDQAAQGNLWASGENESADRL